MFRLINLSDHKEKLAQMNEMKEIYSKLPELLPYIREYRTEFNITPADHAWDFVIDSVFSNRDELQMYQVSAEHLNAIRNASHIEKTKAMVDYEF